MITYKKAFDLMEKKGISMYRLKKDKVIGSTTIEKMAGKREGGIDTRSIDSLCRYLHCQPGDLMEYMEDDRE